MERVDDRRLGGLIPGDWTKISGDVQSGAQAAVSSRVAKNNGNVAARDMGDGLQAGSGDWDWTWPHLICSLAAAPGDKPEYPA